MRAFVNLLRVPNLRALFIVGLLVRIPVAGAGVLLTLHVVTQLGRGYAEAGLLSAVYTVASAIAQPWRGRMLDRSGLRRTMLPSLIALPVLWSIAPWVGYWALMGLSLVAGLLLVPIFSIVRQSIVALAPEELRKSALSLDSVLVEVAFMIGPAAAVLLATALGTPWAMILFYVGGSLLCLVIYALNPPLIAEEADVEPTSSSKRWVTPGVVALLTMMGAATLVLGACDVTIVASLRDIGKPESVAWVLTLWSAGSAVGGIIYGAFPRAIHPAWFLAGMSLMTLPAAFLHTDWAMAAVLCASGLCCAPLIASTVDGLSRVVAPSRFGEAMGWHASAGTVGGAIGAPVAGAVIDSLGWSWAYGFAALAGLAIAVFGGMAIKLRRRRARVA